MFYQLTVSNISRMNLPDNFSTYFGYNCCLWAWCTTLAFDVIISSLKREFQALLEDIAFIVLKGDSLLAATSNYPWNLVCLNQYVYFVLMVFVPYQDNECLPHWYLPPDRPSPFAKFSMSQRSSLEGLPTAKKSYIRNLVFSITINPFIQDFVN